MLHISVIRKPVFSWRLAMELKGSTKRKNMMYKLGFWLQESEKATSGPKPCVNKDKRHFMTVLATISSFYFRLPSGAKVYKQKNKTTVNIATHDDMKYSFKCIFALSTFKREFVKTRYSMYPDFQENGCCKARLRRSLQQWSPSSRKFCLILFKCFLW